MFTQSESVRNIYLRTTPEGPKVRISGPNGIFRLQFNNAARALPPTGRQMYFIRIGAGGINHIRPGDIFGGVVLPQSDRQRELGLNPVRVQINSVRSGRMVVPKDRAFSPDSLFWVGVPGVMQWEADMSVAEMRKPPAVRPFYLTSLNKYFGSEIKMAFVSTAEAAKDLRRRWIKGLREKGVNDFVVRLHPSVFCFEGLDWKNAPAIMLDQPYFFEGTA